MSQTNLTFDQAMEQLASITSQLEQPDLALEKSIQLFEEGLKLSKYCNEQLKIYTDKINTLVKDYDDNESDEAL